MRFFSYFLKSTVNRFLENFNFMTFVGKPFKAQTASGRKVLISTEILGTFPHKTHNWKFQRAGNGLRHSSKTWLLDCSILNEDFFSGDQWSLPGALLCRLLLCGSLQGAKDKKNEKWHCGEAEHSCCGKVNIPSVKHCLFRLFVLGNGSFIRLKIPYRAFHTYFSRSYIYTHTNSFIWIPFGAPSFVTAKY